MDIRMSAGQWSAWTFVIASRLRAISRMTRRFETTSKASAAEIRQSMFGTSLNGDIGHADIERAQKGLKAALGAGSENGPSVDAGG